MRGTGGVRFGRTLRLCLSFGLALAFFAFASPARATFPGANGKIVYDGAAGIYSINPDGSAPTQLTDTSCCGSVDLDPTWSPDGTKIAFERSPEVDFGEIWVMNADGSGQTAIAYSLSFDPAWSPDGSRLAFYWAGSDPGLYVINADGSGKAKITNTSQDERFPSWSPDGSRIAFATLGGDIYTIHPDGSGRTHLTGGGHPSWSPDGSRIAFQRRNEPCPPTCGYTIFVMNADGSGQVGIGTTSEEHAAPTWSPDGTRIAFEAYDGNYSVYVMNADGSGRTRLTSGEFPDWQPLPTAAYSHPQSASQLNVSLVPAFRQCGTGGNPSNAKHAPPLATNSCNPPRPGSVLAAVGGSSQSSAQVTVVPGDSDPTNGNQANVPITAILTDIQSTAGGDYNPNPSGADLTAVTRLRFTDKANGYGGLSATATEYDFRIPIDCSSTSNPSVGSTCSANTTANAVVPGLIQEQRQTVAQAFRVRVDDSGANGVRGDNDDRIFMTQGVFFP